MAILMVGKEVSFYGSPIIKAIVLLTSTATLLSFLLQSFENSLVIKALNTCTLPSISTWIMGVVMLFWSRPLELQLGSLKLMRIIFSSFLTSMCFYLSIFFVSSTVIYLTKYHLSAAIIILISITVTHLFLFVNGNVLFTYQQFHISSHLLNISLLLLMSTSIQNSLPAVLCGVFGAFITHIFGSIPLPLSFLKWSLKLLKTVGAEKQPRLLSGATIDIQRSQRMDLLEGLVMNFQQNRLVNNQRQQRRRGGGGGEGYIPRDDQVRQLTLMGFRWDQAREALITSGGQIHHAIQLLTTNTH